MMRPLFLFMIILFSNFAQAQDSNYSNLWTKVEQFEVEGLPKSALKLVEDIEKKALKENNSPQLIKTMLFKSKYALILEENAQLKIITDFKTKITSSEFPTKHILENILANLYWQYFNQNRWQFYNRTKTSEKIDADDFRTWDLQTLFSETHTHFQKSLENGLMLQQEPLTKYSALLQEQKGSKIYRPTLFDFLNHNALQFYKTNETHITKPAYKFEISNPDFLAPAQRFSILNITSKDSTSLQLHALKIYQSLIRFHLKDKTPFALTDVNIERLKFVNQYATFTNKQDLLKNTLNTESKNYNTHEVSGLYDYELAAIYFQESTQYQSGNNDELRWKAKDALTLCNAVISKFPESKGAEKCEILKSQIKHASIQITTEDFLPIQQNGRLLLRYKNLSELNFKAYQITQKQYEKFINTYRKEEQLRFIKSLNPSKSWYSKLRNEKDYQRHATEVLLPQLDNGRYIIAAFLDEEKSNFAFANIQVTQLALVETESPKHKIFQIINRDNGRPIANAKIEVSYDSRNNKKTITKNYTSNQLGEIKIDKNKNWYRNVKLKAETGNDTAYFGNYYINQSYNQAKDEKDSYHSFVFTDRSIYRPGQTVYFKGIAMKTTNGKTEVAANELVYATLFNSNGEEIKELEFTTNDFGSVSGEFILPNNGLNGEFYIEFDGDKNDFFSEHYFSVEEYKRPKFETKFNPVKDTFKVNDSITVNGQALAFAGSNITDAKVVYRVHRKVQYPHWYFWYRPNVYSEPQEISHGESKTNENGEFKITFKAIPDQSVDKSSLPIFKYEITADVTDLNGESRSATTIVNVGYHALIANMTIDNPIDKTKKGTVLTIDTKNLNGEFVPAKGTIKIYKLKAPNAVLRARPWAAPDYQEFSREEFKVLFPHDAYTNEHLSSNWKKGKMVLEKSFNTNDLKTLKLGKLKKWKSGLYLITLESRDKFGQLVKDEIKTNLFSTEDETPADRQLFTITTNKTSYNPGDLANVTVGSAAKNIMVTLAIEKDKKIIKTEVVSLNANKKTISIPVTQDDLGGFVVHYSLAAFNSFLSGSETISVPYPSKELDIQINTFRDKLQPGTDETWSFNIKGPKGDKVSAELLASMYDASLDMFKPHTWHFNPIQTPTYSAISNRRANNSFGTQSFRVYQDRFIPNYTHQAYDQLNWFGYNNILRIRGNSSVSKTLSGRISGVQVVENDMEVEESVALMKVNDEAELEEVVVTGVAPEKNNTDEQNLEQQSFENIGIRKNLQETAFFFPHLQTDQNGNVSFSFTTPEALTQWKLQLLAHTKTLESATKTLTTVTQKELMVVPNAPRFLRKGDQITISTKIANLTDKTLSGYSKLLLTDAISGKDITNKLIDSSLSEVQDKASFTVNAKGNTQVSWNLSIPDDVDAIQYKIVAKSGNYSDGEQNALPVLSNRMLVTETLPMWVRSNETKTFVLDKLKTTTPTTLKNHKLTLEITSNPAWYAVQALPYLMEYPYECNEQTFSRYYSNALASHIANSNPRIQEVFNQWRNTDALLSNLEKNEELRSVLIQETPWVRDAQSETEQKKRIALLFDLNKMTNELQSAMNKLKTNQMPSGAWSWFKGGYENRYITQHIISGFGHLSKLGVSLNAVKESQNQIIRNAIQYLDYEFIKEYNNIRKHNKDADLSKDHLSYTQLHYLYMRSFFPEIKKSKDVENISAYYQTQINKYWLSRSLYSKGLMALISKRNNELKTVSKILNSLKETSITSEELGMYWKSNTNSWYWYQAPVETQALLIEVFSEAGSVIQSETNNVTDIDNLKIWLLKNKQTNRWKTTKATTEAVYALLLQGSDWLPVTDMVNVVLGKQKIEPLKLEAVKVEAGTGYYKTTWNASEIKPNMAEVTISKTGKGIAWGSLYWQYFEDLDQITSAETPLKLNKNLFLKTNTDTGEMISKINNKTQLKVGDMVRVRIELRSDRNMEFIHMKDMRASGLEPVNVLSSYKWQDGLGYYESTKDASTNFFFDYLPKGVYVFEYDLRVNNSGNMSNGITTIQSMYAPEFSSHSEGSRIIVK